MDCPHARSGSKHDLQQRQPVLPPARIRRRQRIGGTTTISKDTMDVMKDFDAIGATAGAGVGAAGVVTIPVGAAVVGCSASLGASIGAFLAWLFEPRSAGRPRRAPCSWHCWRKVGVHARRSCDSRQSFRLGRATRATVTGAGLRRTAPPPSQASALASPPPAAPRRCSRRSGRQCAGVDHVRQIERVHQRSLDPLVAQQGSRLLAQLPHRPIEVATRRPKPACRLHPVGGACSCLWWWSARYAIAPIGVRSGRHSTTHASPVYCRQSSDTRASSRACRCASGRPRPLTR